MAGTDGNFEQLLAKARFEEAKQRDLGGAQSNHNRERSRPSEPSTRPQRDFRQPSASSGASDSQTGVKCYNCQQVGHRVRNFPHPRHPKGQEEARG